MKSKGYATLPEYAADMAAEYIHEFSDAEAEFVTDAKDFRILVDARKFESMVRDLAVSKPKFIGVQSHYGIPDGDGDARYDALVVNGTDLPLGFITTPAKL